MIQEFQQTVYSACCDGCGRDFEHSYEGWSVWFDRDSLTERISDQEWHIGDGEQGIKDFIYCPNCHKIDDNDNFILTEVSPVYQVINDFPGNKDFVVGDVVRFEREAGVIWQHKASDCQGERIYTPMFFDKYPYLFKKIQ